MEIKIISKITIKNSNDYKNKKSHNRYKANSINIYKEKETMIKISLTFPYKQIIKTIMNSLSHHKNHLNQLSIKDPSK